MCARGLGASNDTIDLLGNRRRHRERGRDVAEEPVASRRELVSLPHKAARGSRSGLTRDLPESGRVSLQAGVGCVVRSPQRLFAV